MNFSILNSDSTVKITLETARVQLRLKEMVVCGVRQQVPWLRLAHFPAQNVDFQQSQTDFGWHSRKLMLGVWTALSVVMHCNTKRSRSTEVEFSDTPFWCSQKNMVIFGFSMIQTTYLPIFRSIARSIDAIQPQTEVMFKPHEHAPSSTLAEVGQVGAARRVHAVWTSLRFVAVSHQWNELLI